MYPAGESAKNQKSISYVHSPGRPDRIGSISELGTTFCPTKPELVPWPLPNGENETQWIKSCFFWVCPNDEIHFFELFIYYDATKTEGTSMYHKVLQVQEILWKSDSLILWYNAVLRNAMCTSQEETEGTHQKSNWSVVGSRHNNRRCCASEYLTVCKLSPKTKATIKSSNTTTTTKPTRRAGNCFHT